jgi:hypothetical protein
MAENNPATAGSNEDIPYHFHAHAHAFSAHFVRPSDVPIPAQAAIALPSTGGFAHTKVEDFAEPRLVSFKLGESHVAGSWEKQNIVTTSAISTLAGLNLLDFLTIDKLVSRLTGRYVQDEKNKESHIIAFGSYFHNFRLGGYEIGITLRHKLLLDSQNFQQLKDNLGLSTGVGAVHCSLVEKIDVPSALEGLVKVDGHILVVRDFGKIALAEIFATPGSVTLTMLRFKLGSPDGGTGSGGQSGTNGQPSP